MSEIPTPPERIDVVSRRIVVAALGATVILTAALCGALAVLGHDVPSPLYGMGTTALGALTGMLSSAMRAP